MESAVGNNVRHSINMKIQKRKEEFLCWTTIHASPFLLLSSCTWFLASKKMRGSSYIPVSIFGFKIPVCISSVFSAEDIQL